MHPVFIFIEVFFIIGITATFLANKNASAQTKKERWKKLGVHFLLVHLIVFCITETQKYFLFLLIIIILTGLYELVILLKQKFQPILFYIIAFIVYGICSALFYYFNSTANQGKIVFLFLLVFTFDGFSQITGQLFGKRKLFPKVSPGKTVEGLIGGSLITIITAYLTWGWVSELHYFIFIFSSAAIIIISSITGDWLASYFKRKHSVKDYSDIIPGHGGFLDRFDSWIFTSAIIALIEM
ncbi:MAG: phosphatidate cytidylyltransferase [Fimbriimonadaceae bacterium]|nr:phosphatidate cytidylyltransferase [Chitinophagales bacterium]